MRKPKFNEIFVMLFSLYVWFTLTVAPELFVATNGKSGDIYEVYIGMVGNQHNLSLISACVSLLYFASLFTKKYGIITWIHIVGLMYFLFIGASFLINYPNIALGVMSMASVWLFVDLMRLIDKAEEAKKNKILKKNGIEQ
ncbi:hypothetical protein [Macrococcus armenti]|uniref:hypothetical protein n=1 Tax=Macrococcus armenti TaxID=2875764 RepID=UPI001CCD618F|nr:hypothetical protein [Macrococcus armenti]UBH16413.1 hypothetical protein LAU44_05505 [Macrococcus armenti]UBH18769.1 hypothetical protein LAU39_05515 [Macrococcus armenti]UBH21041.1 hypothetical protein LAU40_05510 [Macrococcus armenti]